MVGGANGLKTWPERRGGGEDKQTTCLFFHLGRKIEIVLVGRERREGGRKVAREVVAAEVGE